MAARANGRITWAYEAWRAADAAVEAATHDDKITWGEWDRLLEREADARDRLADKITTETGGAISRAWAYQIIREEPGRIPAIAAATA